jgi:hypothetical protein
VRYGKKPTKQSQPRVKIYLSKAEAAMLKKQAQDLHLSVSAYLRGLIRTEGDHFEKR